MNKILNLLFLIFAFSLLFTPESTLANDLETLLNQVEKLKIEHYGYTIGKVLNKDQIKLSRSHPLQASVDGTFRFQDKELFIVAHKATNRVLMVYKLFEAMPQKNIQNLVGELNARFKDPTTLDQDKIVYWAYARAGKISSDQFDTAKKNKIRLDILATIKFVSEIQIMGKQIEPVGGRAFYIISSDQALEHLKLSNL